MGWWKVSGSDTIIGDLPLDAIGDAFATVVALYQEEYGRKPTRSEWEALLRTVLGTKQREYRCIDEGVVAEVSIKVE